MKRTMLLRLGLLSATGIAAAGCATDNSSAQTFFPPPEAYRRVDQAADAQAIAGARQDATLGDHHFDSSRLNSLGRQKLNMLVPDSPEAEVVVYLNLEDTRGIAQCRDSVRAYLNGLGVQESQIAIHDGPNPAAGAPAAAGLARLSRTESGGRSEPSGAASSGYGSSEPMVQNASGR